MAKKYSILVRNSQGASDGYVGTRAEINAWLHTWDDPENLSASVTDEIGELVAHKLIGRKRISWPTTMADAEPR